MELRRKAESPRERAEREHAAAQAAEARALVEYVAMMSDVDIPSETETEGEVEDNG